MGARASRQNQDLGVMGFSGFVRRRVRIRLGGIRGFGEKGGAGESKILKIPLILKILILTKSAQPPAARPHPSLLLQIRGL